MTINSLADVPAIASYLRRIGAEPRGLKTAVIVEQRGKYWKDIAVIRLMPDGTIQAPPPYLPTESEIEKITEGLKNVNFPTQVMLERLVGNDLPDAIKNAPKGNVFTLCNKAGQVIMTQVRQDEGATKKYIPFTFWSDGIWRQLEPEGKLPLWGLEKLGDHTTVFIHEGAKAAKACHELVNPRTPEEQQRLALHPWGKELSNAAHVGWIGGALSPGRTDWSALSQAGITRVYIVSDNDFQGRSSITAISKALRARTFQIQFTSEWPVGFDLADAFPETFYTDGLEGRLYSGPTMRDCQHPATWATDVIPGKEKGEKKTILLRDEFVDLWYYIDGVDTFICSAMPEIMRGEAIFNKMVRPFSDVFETSKLLVKRYHGRTAKLCYRPDQPGLIAMDNSTSAINLHVPSQIKAKAGDAQPWVEFLDYLFPNSVECHQVKRWLATLIAKPSVHMLYGILLISENQGIGKTTLAASILQPLLGRTNVSWPSENDVANSAYNGWAANKRLVVASEIYSGASWKAYHKLKSMITDERFRVNEKYEKGYEVDNVAHFIICSNSRSAIKVEQNDRRFFYPEMTEIAWPLDRFAGFRLWLERGGLEIIKHWAETFNDYVREGEFAPATPRKAELIEDSRSEAQQIASELGSRIFEWRGMELDGNGKPTDKPEHDVNCPKQPAAITMRRIREYCAASSTGKIFDSDSSLRKAMRDQGCFQLKDRVYVGGSLQYVMANPQAFKTLSAIIDRKSHTQEVDKCAKATDIKIEKKW